MSKLIKKKRRLLVTGNMRCGTTWLTHALKPMLDVEHECLGADGTVSWPFAIDHTWYVERPNNPPKGRTHHIGEGRRSDYEFEHVVHLVRNPLKTIGSMVSIMPRSEQEWLAEARMLDMDAKPKLLRMMQAWFYINTEVEEQADLQINIENIHADWYRLMKLLRLESPFPEDLPVKNASRGIFKAKIITVDDMRSVDAELARNIMRMGNRYGY